jgi:hypothetical protein
MTDALFPTRLRWQGLAGFARFANVGGAIGDKPQIPGLPTWEAIDYAPGAVSLIQEPGQDWRDLDADEVSAVLRWLRYRPRP